MVLKDPFGWPPMECRGECAAANLQAESYLEREHNARWAALSVTHTTSGCGANNGARVPITMSGFTKEQYVGVMQILNLDAMSHEGMIFHCAGQASGGWRVFDIWDLQGAFAQFLPQAARLITKDPHFPPPAKNSINFQIQNLLPESSLSPLRNRRINLPSGSRLSRGMLWNRILHYRNTTK